MESYERARPGDILFLRGHIVQPVLGLYPHRWAIKQFAVSRSPRIFQTRVEIDPLRCGHWFHDL
jgi:hypothetical protein